MSNDLGIPVSSGNFELLPTGEYDAVIHGIINLGLRPVEFQGEVKAPAVFIKLVLELPDKVREDGMTTVVSKKIKLTNSVDKGNYAKLLTTLGEKVTKANMNSYLSSNALKALLGKSVIVTVDHWQSDDGVKATVRELLKLDPRLPQPKATRETFFFNPLAPDLAVFKDILTYYTKKEVMEALNASNFPAELHAAWAEEQEKKALADKNRVASGAVKTDTSAIE